MWMVYCLNMNQRIVIQGCPLKPSDVDMIERIPIPVTPAPKHVRAFWLEARSGGGSKDAIRHVGPVMVVFYTISAVILIL